MKFMNLNDGARSKYYILPISYEGSVSYGKGASKGAFEILKASHHLEYYDEDLEIEPNNEKIYTQNLLKLNDLSPKDAMIKIKDAVENKFTIGIGGDHSVTIGFVKGFENFNNKFSVIVLDAHTDLFHSWNGSEFNHRCVSQRISENHKVLSVGTRSMDIDEVKLIKDKENVEIVKAYEYNKDSFLVRLKKLEKNVYISIDVDVFDPSIIGNTGTPEPGGFDWYRVIEILKLIFANRNVIGADVVEFAPQENFRAEAFTLAKLVYKIFGLKKINSKYNRLN